MVKIYLPGTKRSHTMTGFTLVELLMVIAIVAIIASLLVFGITGAKAATNATVCKSNLRQIGIAMQMYVGDTGYYPSLLDKTGLNSHFFNYYNWMLVLDKEVGGQLSRINNGQFKLRDRSFKSIFTCPDYARLTTNLFPYSYNCDGVSDQMYNNTSFGRLGLGGARTMHEGSLACEPIKENEVIKPSQMIGVGDSVFINHFSQEGANSNLSKGVNYGISLFKSIVPEYKHRHGGRWNIQFCDGHVESFKPELIFDNRNTSVRKLWNKDNEPHFEFPPS